MVLSSIDGRAVAVAFFRFFFLFLREHAYNFVLFFSLSFYIPQGRNGSLTRVKSAVYLQD